MRHHLAVAKVDVAQCTLHNETDCYIKLERQEAFPIGV